jgi:hypothetical protein
MVWSVGSQRVFMGPGRFRECVDNGIYEGMEGSGESGGVQSIGIL